MALYCFVMTRLTITARIAKAAVTRKMSRLCLARTSIRSRGKFVVFGGGHRPLAAAGPLHAVFQSFPFSDGAA